MPALAGTVARGRLRPLRADFPLGSAPGPGCRRGLVSFAWVYDTVAGRYQNIRRRISAGSGCTWTDGRDIGIADQAGHPAMLPDGRIVLAWVDRFGSGSIRVRVAARVSGDQRAMDIHYARLSL